MSGIDWKFVQTAGQKKTLTLTGWAAPRGRPRQAPVVTTGVQVRNSRTYYPGNDAPTRHVFGTQHPDWQLEGRFMDCDGGPRYAQNMLDYVTGFVADAHPVVIRWGEFVSARGMIVDFEPGIESHQHVSWKMTIQIDEDLLLQKRKNRSMDFDRAVAEHAQNEIKDYLQKQSSAKREQLSIVSFPPSLDFGISAALDSLVGAANAPWAALSQMLDDIGKLETAPWNALMRLKAGQNQAKTALLHLKDTHQAMHSSMVIMSKNESERTRFWSRQHAAGAEDLKKLKVLDDIDRAIQRAMRGMIRGMYVARTSDTWESIARVAMEDVKRADDIRSFNGVGSGPPAPGTRYLIPQ